MARDKLAPDYSANTRVGVASGVAKKLEEFASTAPSGLFFVTELLLITLFCEFIMNPDAGRRYSSPSF